MSKWQPRRRLPLPGVLGAYYDCQRTVSRPIRQLEMRRRLTLIGAMMVKMGDADGMVCGTVGTYHDTCTISIR